MCKSLWVVVFVLAGGACSDERGFELGRFGTLAVAPAALEIVISEAPRGGETAHELVLSNTGSGPLTVRALTLTAVDAGALPVRIAPLEVPFEIGPGATRALSVVYVRVDDVPRELDLAIASSDPLTPVVHVPIEIIEGVAHLVVHPTPVVFEQTSVPLSETVRLLSTGNAPLRVTRLTLVAPADFAVTIDGAQMDGGAPAELRLEPAVVIEPGADHALEVRFEPQGTTRVTGELRVFSDAEVAGVPVPLVGNEAGPCLVVRPSRLTFGTRNPGDVVELPAELENCGAEDVEVTAVRLADAADAADPALAALAVEATSARFELVGEAGAGHPIVLAPGEVHTLMVRYRAWSEAELGGVAGTYRDVGAVVVESSSWVGTDVVHLDAATELVLVPEVAGCEWQGGEITKHHVAVTVTADNYYELWVNGEQLASDSGHWANEDRIELDLDSGCHVIGIHAWGDGSVTAGMIAAVEVDGVVRWTTGEGKPEWSVTGPDAPPGDWHDLFYDDSAWADPHACTTTSQWGTGVDPMLALGARWVWWNAACDDELATAWFRLTFTAD